MFDMYDDDEAVYRLKYSSNGGSDFVTAHALYEFFMLEEHKLLMTFSELLKQLDRGDVVYAEQWVYNWTSGTNEYEGAIVLSKPSAKSAELPPPIPTQAGYCSHKDKYVNEAGGTKFWFFRICKKDLGDVK
jgi:hypothetical protein